MFEAESGKLKAPERPKSRAGKPVSPKGIHSMSGHKSGQADRVKLVSLAPPRPAQKAIPEERDGFL